MAESQTLFRLSQVLPLYIFSIPGSHPGSHIAFPLSGSFVSAGLWQCHHLSCFSWPPNLRFYLVICHALPGLWIWGKTTEVKCPSVCILSGPWCQQGLLGGRWPGDAARDLLVRCGAQLSPPQSSFFSSVYILLLKHWGFYNCLNIWYVQHGPKFKTIIEDEQREACFSSQHPRSQLPFSVSCASPVSQCK